jgi:hypothetical protein
MPQFKRVPGVEVRLENEPYDVPRLHPALKLADYGTCLAHLRAWKAAAAGDADWHVILEVS